MPGLATLTRRLSPGSRWWLCFHVPGEYQGVVFGKFGKWGFPRDRHSLLLTSLPPAPVKVPAGISDDHEYSSSSPLGRPLDRWGLAKRTMSSQGNAAPHPPPERTVLSGEEMWWFTTRRPSHRPRARKLRARARWPHSGPSAGSLQPPSPSAARGVCPWPPTLECLCSRTCAVCLPKGGGKQPLRQVPAGGNAGTADAGR